MYGEYLRARVKNPAPVPLRLYNSRTLLQHETGRVHIWRDPREAVDMPPVVVTVPPLGEAEIGIDLFSSSLAPPVLPGKYTVWAEFRSLESPGNLYTSTPASLTVTEQDIKDYRAFYGGR
jgi:hypothetical protein